MRRFDCGVGIGYANGILSSENDFGNPIISSSLFLSIRPFGYVYQKTQGGAFFKIGAVLHYKIKEFNDLMIGTPEYVKSNSYILTSVGVGYTFKNTKL
ncbi:MAG: hypothetical protein IPM77_06505 [Crocinitomicaceae bacterium]|nr:hypothetical protein [Crocinitomicaceae bacterium]